MCTGFSDTVEPAFPASIVKCEPGPPMTLGSAARAELRLVVWCRGYGHQVELDLAYLAERSVPTRRHRRGVAA